MSRTGGARLGALCTAAWLCTLAAAPAARAQPDAPSDPTAALLARRVPELTERAEIPGLSMALVRGGRVVWTGAFGLRNRETGRPVTGETVFQAASLSKPVFAYAALRLAERGVLDLDRPLAEILPNARMAHDDRYRRITSRLVLHHSTGLPNWGGDTLKLEFDPGTGFRYSGEGYVYLAQVIESVTGLSFDEVVRREVFEPLGMTRSSYLWQDRFEDDAAVGHDNLGRARPLFRAEEANAAASLLTTAGDYGRFLAAVLSGRGLAPATRAEIFLPHTRADVSWAREEANDAVRWGLGWGLQVGDGPQSFWHWGDNGTFRAFVAGFPEAGVAVVYFTNSNHGLSIAEEIVRLAAGTRHSGPAWAGYERHDDPARVARRGVFHAFADDGLEAGTERLAQMRRAQPELFDVELATDLAGLLADAELGPAAVRVLEAALDAFPDSIRVLDGLGQAYLRSGLFQEALETYRCLAAHPGDPETVEGYRARIRWVELRLEATRSPVEVAPERLRALAGDYGPRHVTLEGDALYYQREGNPRFRLVPLAPDLFQPIGLETFRIRFVEDDAGRPTKIVGLYFGGGRDETPRDEAPRDGT